ncbi:hypothetical protein [Streptomyces sp. NPDC050548]|uniref:hypothetical protein n=1 Tax=Streptomyces sp. NPDC050548 TaxID=3365629 RepID=UPI0037AA2F68
MTPVDDDLVGVAVLSRTRRGYDEHLADFPTLTASLRGRRGADRVRGAYSGLFRVTPERVRDPVQAAACTGSRVHEVPRGA